MGTLTLEPAQDGMSYVYGEEIARVLRREDIAAARAASIIPPPE